MYNKKVLIDSLKKLGSAKAPAVKKDVIMNPNMGASPMMFPQTSSVPMMKSGGTKMLSVKKSSIDGAGKGLFAEKGFRKNQLIGLAHQDGQPVGEIGNMHNHSDNPNMYSIMDGNKRYVYAKRDIQPGEELTTNYRLQPELEQPEDFMRRGGSAPKLPKKKNSKAYSRSIEATNRLFAQHPLFAKTRSRKNKIYDPNAKYYQEGGITYNNLPATYQSALQNFVYPNIEADPTRTGYNSVNNTISYDPESSIENMNNDWWREHELFHHLQNQAGGMSTSGIVGQRPNPYVASDESLRAYYDRRDADIERTIDAMIAQNPDLQFIPRHKLAEGAAPGFIGAEDLQYSDPSTLEGEARQYEQYIREGNPSIFPKKQDGGVPYNYNQFTSVDPEAEETPIPFNPIRTENEPEDYNQFLEYSESAPENRRPYSFYGDPNEYDHYGMWDALGKPKNFEEALQMNPDWQPDPYDGYYHGFSVNPNTGVFLKSGKPGFKEGDTTWMEINGHYLSPRANESTPVYDPDLQRFKYIPNEEDESIETELTPEEIEEYAKGGYIIEDISVPSLTKAQTGGGVGALVRYGTEASKIISGAGKVTPFLRFTNRAITPVGYGMMQKITAAPLTFVAPYKPKTFALQNRYDAWDIYNQAAPRYGGLFANDDGSVGIKKFEISKDVLDKIRESKKISFETIDFNDDLLGGDAVNFGGVHGNGHAIKGVDEEGRKYIDFTDVWDLHPMEGFKFLPKSIRSLEAGKLTGGKPFQLRNRIYYDKDGQYFDHDGNSLIEYEREVPDMSIGSGLKKMQQNASKGNIEMLPEYNVSKRKFLTTQNISQDQFNAVEDDWDAAINRNRFYQLGTLGTGLGLGAYGAFQYEQSTKPKFVLNTESGQFELVTPAQIKAFPGRYIVDPRTKQKYGGALPKKQGGGLVKYSELIPALRSLTPGNALRATLYRGINPASYNVMEKAKGFPSELYGSAFNNETRPFRVGMSLKYGADEYLDTFLKTKRLTRQEFDKMPDSEKMMLFNEDTRNILQDIGRRRLDAWAVGLKQPQEYGTLEQIGDNTFRMKDIDYTPDFFSERYTDLQAQGLKDKGYYFGDEDPLVTLSRKHYDITPHPFMQRGVAKNFLEQELLEKYGNASRSFIDKALGYSEPDFAPWSPLRHVGKSTINPDPSFEHSVWDNDSYGVMGGFRWDIANTPEGMHWQANDLWDINPWERRGSALLNPNDTILKYLHGNYFKPLQNFEALSAVGGRPFNIQNNFLIDPVTFKPLKKWQKGGFLKRKKKQPAVVPPLDIVQPGEEAFPLPETPQTQLWYDPITVDTTMTQEQLDAYNKAYEEEQARLKFEADKAAQPGYFDEARTWLTDWHNSPMYNQMVLNSYRGNQGNADYLTKLRKKNIETMPPLNVLGEDDGSAAAHSITNTGQVEVFPSGYKYGPSIFVHEGLHSSDRPRELYKFDHPAYNTHKHMDDITMDDYIKVSGKNESYFTDNGIVYDYPDWMVYNDPRFPNEDAVWHDRLMPQTDQLYITSHRGSNWKDNQLYKEAKNSGLLNVKTDEELKKDMIESGINPNDPEFNNIFESVKKGSKISAQDNAKALKESWKNYGHGYMSSPTEVRARLGEIRYGAQKQGIYDPFTEQITPEIFQNLINNGSSWQMQDAIDELRTDFTDEEIFWMLQNISKNDSEEENPFDEQMAKFGGAKRKLKRRQNGGPTAQVEESLEEPPTDPPAGPVLTEAQQWITDWYKNRKLPTIQEDPRYNKDMMKILPAYNPESPILTNTTTFPQYIMDPSLGNLNPEGLNIGAAGTYEETKEGPVIRLNPALTPAQKTDTEIHELTNYMMAPVRDKLYNMQDRIVEQNIIPFNEDWTDEQKDFYDYVINHDEQNIQSYLNVARKNFGLKADEVITPEKIQEMKQQAEKKGMLDHSNPNFNPDIYLLFKMGKDEQGLSNLFNHIAKVDNESEDNSFMNYGKYGGAYELGDEVDEATMKKLKKLGYTFEKI